MDLGATADALPLCRNTEFTFQDKLQAELHSASRIYRELIYMYRE